MELGPARARSRLALGQLLAERQRVDEAVEQIRQAAKLAGPDPAYAYDLGLALRLQGDLDGAEAQLRAAVAGNPGHAEAHRALGLILRQKGDLRAAAAELRASVAARPGDAQAHNILGTILLKLEDLDGAMGEFRTATELDPGLTEAQVNLGQALMKAGRGDEARAALADVQRLKERETGRSRTMLLLEMGAKQLDRGDAAAAVAALRDAVAASPDFAEARSGSPWPSAARPRDRQKSRTRCSRPCAWIPTTRPRDTNGRGSAPRAATRSRRWTSSAGRWRCSRAWSRPSVSWPAFRCPPATGRPPPLP